MYLCTRSTAIQCTYIYIYIYICISTQHVQYPFKKDPRTTYLHMYVSGSPAVARRSSSHGVASHPNEEKDACGK